MIKTIFFSISATLTMSSFVFYLFLNTILASFGLVSTSIESLNELHQSKKVVQKMQKRHTVKKNNFSKKFTTRAGAKLSSTASSAIPIVGSVGAVIAIASLEAHYYCEDKKELQEDENILFDTRINFDSEDCLQEAQYDSKQVIVAATESVTQSVTNTWNELTE